VLGSSLPCFQLEAERDFYKDKYEQSVTPLMKPRPASPKSGSLDERYRMKRETRTASVEIRTFENHIKNANRYGVQRYG